MFIFVIFLRNYVIIFPRACYNWRWKGDLSPVNPERLPDRQSPGNRTETKTTMKNNIPHVAVLAQPSTAWGRRLIRGVIDYARQHGPWRLWTATGAKDDPLRLPAGWNGDGIIARLSTYAMARQVSMAKKPVVNVSRVLLKDVTFPRVSDDVDASARMSIEHFMDRGFKHFAYYGQRQISFLVNHRSAFIDALHALGQSCHVYQSKKGAGWRQTQQKDIANWLISLPKPVGLLAWSVPDGQQIVDACRSVGLLVPEQVAVLAGDDDELMCEVCSPPLSGVAIASEQIGREAAALLSRLMQKGSKSIPKTPKPILVPPQRIVTRQSTDTLAINDPDIVTAIRFIREHESEPIQVPDVLRAVPVSRSQLERKFVQFLGRAPASEIRRIHLQRAGQLLAETNLSIPDVAAASGFSSPEYLMHAFKSVYGVSPLKYRNRIQRGYDRAEK